MERPRDRSAAHSQRAYDVDPRDRRPSRSGAHQGPRSSPSMTRRRMTETDEGDMDQILEHFEDVGINPRKHSSLGGLHDRRGSRSLDDIDSFDEEDIDSPRLSTRGGRRGGRSMGRHHMDVKDSFDEEEADSRGPYTSGKRQGGRDTGRGHFDAMDSFDEEDTDPPRPSTRGGGQGERDMERLHFDAMDSFDEEDTDFRGPSTRPGPRGKRGTASAYMDEPAGNMDSHVPRGSRGSRSQTAKLKTILRGLEAELDLVEEDKKRIDRSLKTSRNQDAGIEKLNEAVYRIMEIKMEIYKINPKSERVDNTARFFLHLPAKVGNHEERGLRYGHQDSAPGLGGGHSRRTR